MVIVSVINFLPFNSKFTIHWLLSEKEIYGLFKELLECKDMSGGREGETVEVEGVSFLVPLCSVINVSEAQLLHHLVPTVHKEQQHPVAINSPLNLSHVVL